MNPDVLAERGIALCMAAERTRDIRKLRSGIRLLRKAVKATPPGSANRSTYLSSLGNALSISFNEFTGEPSDLDQAIACQRAALDSAPLWHPERPMYLANLGGELVNRSGRTRRLEDLDEAIDILSQSVEAAPLGHPRRPGRLSKLAQAFMQRSVFLGKPDGLDQSIAHLRAAVAATPPGHRERTMYLANLGGDLRVRYFYTGQVEDLDHAYDCFSEAVDASSPQEPNMPGYLSSLGNVLMDRYERTGQLEDLDQSVSTGKMVVDSTLPSDPYRSLYLSNLGVALRTRYERTGRPDDLDQAIDAGKKAVDSTMPGHRSRHSFLFNLGNALQVSYERTGRLDDLDQAIAVGKESVDATSPDDPIQPEYLSSLGNALWARYERTGHHPDLAQAIASHRKGAGIPTAPPASRLRAARQWGLHAMLAGVPEDALHGYTAAIELLPLVAWHGLDQATREHRLREWSGLASDAAAAAISAGSPVRGVELLEAGRSLLWTQVLNLRQDLADLKEIAPGLAARLEASRAVLNASPATVDGRQEPGLESAADQMLEHRRQAARDWDTAVHEARQIEGFEQFLLPVPFSILQPAADGGRVVVVNVSKHRTDALIITAPAGPGDDPSVVTVNLPEAPVDAVNRQVAILLAAQERAGDPAHEWLTVEDDRRAVLDVLAWCWKNVVEPVLGRLDYAHIPEGDIEDWPRLWWCPAGPIALLPLHAAGLHPRTTTQHQAMDDAESAANSVTGRVISSYTPTLTALARARTRPIPDRIRQVAVGVPDAPSYAPGAGPLPGVYEEFETLGTFLPEPEKATHLLGPVATRDAVLSDLPGHSWLHLSCHGRQNREDASLSAFFLDDQPLTLADISSVDLREADLAYLAACQTATGDVRLPDEALHLAGALRLIGYRHVLATMWNISDDYAPDIAKIIYSHLLQADADPEPADQPQADRAPYAVHNAVTSLRRAFPADPLLWAPYIHVGP